MDLTETEALIKECEAVRHDAIRVCAALQDSLDEARALSREIREARDDLARQFPVQSFMNTRTLRGLT